MKDAGIEAKRDSAAFTAVLGDYATRVDAALKDSDQANVINRIWNKDASVWKSEKAHHDVIANALGWLTVPEYMRGLVEEMKEFAEEIKSAGFRHVMVCGMGGSSLCPEVLRQTFGEQQGFPELLVLDSTDPDVIDQFRQQIDVSSCLFIVASKSGTTTEPIAFHRFWYDQVQQANSEPGRFFAAITDPGTHMEGVARAEKFRRIFLNPSDIGGRYSALSYFGMVPAALMGLDTANILERAGQLAQACRSRATEAGNFAAKLGAILAECALAGRDKLTIVTDSRLATLGLWIEQLIAESTGKEGKGIVPVIGEPLSAPETYGDDRVFVSISAGDERGDSNEKLKALERIGHPVVYRNLASLNDLGAEFFLWEMATAFAGWRLGINPFDQPNVQESKDATKALLERYTSEGKLREPEAAASDGALTIYSAEDSEKSASVRDLLVQHIRNVQPGDYVALLAYVEETPEIAAALQGLRLSIQKLSGCATTVGYGPRFLHSTGQLHKGGPDNGVFFQITAPDQVDFDVPGAPYSFSVLKQAQAQGDFQSLLAHGRRAIRVDVGENAGEGLERLRALLLSEL